MKRLMLTISEKDGGGAIWGEGVEALPGSYSFFGWEAREDLRDAVQPLIEVMKSRGLDSVTVTLID